MCLLCTIDAWLLVHHALHLYTRLHSALCSGDALELWRYRITIRKNVAATAKRIAVWTVRAKSYPSMPGAHGANNQRPRYELYVSKLGPYGLGRYFGRANGSAGSGRRESACRIATGPSAEGREDTSRNSLSLYYVYTDHECL